MRKLIIVALACLACVAASAQTVGENNVTVYCEMECVYYNVFKSAVNVSVDFGIPAGNDSSEGWVYDRTNNKKMSFVSPMAALNYMAQFGWKHKDTFTIVDNDKLSSTSVHYILTKELPASHTASDVVGNICWRHD